MGPEAVNTIGIVALIIIGAVIITSTSVLFPNIVDWFDWLRKDEEGRLLDARRVRGGITCQAPAVTHVPLEDDDMAERFPIEHDYNKECGVRAADSVGTTCTRTHRHSGLHVMHGKGGDVRRYWVADLKKRRTKRWRS